jgi:hypothetical protein
MAKFIRILVLLLWAAGPTALTVASDLSKDQMRSLDDQVQEIKSDVLNIASELSNLEERLLYPTDTQIAVFVALDEGETFRLDAVQITIDGTLAAHHIYNFNELEALQKGGVQRIYTGNVTTGGHEIGISVLGKEKGGGDFSKAASFNFVKGVEPKLLGVTLAGPGFGKDGIQVGEW